jgi:hypothetical protein
VTVQVRSGGTAVTDGHEVHLTRSAYRFTYDGTGQYRLGKTGQFVNIRQNPLRVWSTKRTTVRNGGQMPVRSDAPAALRTE